MKNFKFLTIALIAVLTAVSCSKEDSPMEEPQLVMGQVELDLTNVLVEKSTIGAKDSDVMYATSCQFPDLPTITIPDLFTVKFMKNGAEVYSFGGVSAGSNTFDIALDAYDVEVVSDNYSADVSSSDVILESDVQNIDFRTQKTLNVLLNTKQSLILVAKDNLDPVYTPNILHPTTFQPYILADISTDYWGIYVKSDDFSGGILKITDSQGNAIDTNLPTLDYGALYRYIACPDSEVGISVATGIFEDAPTDVIVE